MPVLHSCHNIEVLLNGLKINLVYVRGRIRFKLYSPWRNKLYITRGKASSTGDVDYNDWSNKDFSDLRASESDKVNFVDEESEKKQTPELNKNQLVEQGGATMITELDKLEQPSKVGSGSMTESDKNLISEGMQVGRHVDCI